MQRKFVIIGLGEFGISVLKTLSDYHMEVLAIDNNPDKIQMVQTIATNAVVADATDENALKALGVGKYDIAVVAIGTNLETSVLISMLLKELGVEMVVAKAVTVLQQRVLQKIEVDKVVLPEVEGGKRLANSLLGPNILDSVEFSDKVKYIEFKTPPNFVGKTIGDLKIRNNYNLNIIGIKHSETDIEFLLQAETEIKPNDILMVIGKMEDVMKFQEKEKIS
ncbi:TrkA family potassium uptake protein [bacterium]|nr:TrkA family potassium uptake protein [bacterium]